MKQVDILLATYNGAAYLPALLDSLFTQSHANFRLICRDDGSTDSTQEILLKCKDPRLSILSDNGNVGVQQNFSRLLMASNSDYVMFCDQDDVWKRTKIEVTLNKMIALENQYGMESPLLVHTDLAVVDRYLNEISPSFWKFAHLNPKKFQTLNRLIVQNGVTGCAMMLNRKLAELAKPIPEGVVMHDWWAALIAAGLGQIGFLNEQTISYRQHQANQLGAIKYSLKRLIQEGINRRLIQKGINRPFRKRSLQYGQVEAFYSRFQPLLLPEQKQMVEAYLNLPQGSYIKGRFDIIRYGLWKCGFFRQLGSLLFSKQP